LGLARARAEPDDVHLVAVGRADGAGQLRLDAALDEPRYRVAAEPEEHEERERREGEAHGRRGGGGRCNAAPRPSFYDPAPAGRGTGPPASRASVSRSRPRRPSSANTRSMSPSVVRWEQMERRRTVRPRSWEVMTKARPPARIVSVIAWL